MSILNFNRNSQPISAKAHYKPKTERKYERANDVVDFCRILEKHGDRVALTYFDKKRALHDVSYAELEKYVKKVAAGITAMGLSGKKIAVIGETSVTWLSSYLGTLASGGVVIPMDKELETSVILEFLAWVDADAIIYSEKFNAAFEGAKGNHKSLKYFIPMTPAENAKEDNYTVSFDKLLEIGEAEIENGFSYPAVKDKEKLAELLFTSGTTGYPKIALHTHRYPLGHFITAKYWHNVDPNGLHFTISDTGWGKALWGKLYGQWLCEAGIFTYDFDRFIADDILKMIGKHKITTFCAPPTMYRFFIKEDLANYDLSSIKYATTAGEALNPEVFHQFLKATGLRIMEGFGQTETTLALANFVGTSIKVGSMGKPSPLYDVDIITSEGKTAKVGEVGEIVVKTDAGSPCGLFMEYYLDEEKTKEAWSDNIYHTGDTAWRDEDGFFWYVGRVDDVIKSSGYRIGPFEIESVIMELPYVLECAVSAAPDEIRGQVVKADIVLTKGTEKTDALKKEIQAYVKEHTAPYKYPRIVEFRDELPKTISGKIRRVELREANKNK